MKPIIKLASKNAGIRRLELYYISQIGIDHCKGVNKTPKPKTLSTSPGYSLKADESSESKANQVVRLASWTGWFASNGNICGLPLNGLAEGPFLLQKFKIINYLPDITAKPLNKKL